MLDATIHSLIADRRAGSSAGGLIDLLLAAKFADGSAMSDTEVRDQLVSFVAAGHETLAVSLTWALYWIYRQPQIRERLLTELDQAGWPTDPETIAALPYLDAVYRETLRISPILPEVDPSTAAATSSCWAIACRRVSALPRWHLSST